MSPLGSFAPWSLVFEPPAVPNRVFFQDCEDGIGTLAFETTTAPISRVLSSRAIRSPLLSTEICFYSSSCLQGLIGVIPCTLNSVAISGLTLVFADGHRECVGQVRVDRAGEHLPVRDTWFITFTRDREGRPFVASVILRSGDESTTDDAMEVSCNGVLEWFWSSRQCLLRYKGQESLRPGYSM